MDGSKTIQVELYYAYHKTDTGIYHAFEAVDPAACMDDKIMAEKLAAVLHANPNGESFECKSMLIDIPDNMIRQIRSDALREYVKSQERPGHGFL